MLPDGVAVIEMAAAAGLPLVGERLHAEQTTTYGVGELMAHALERGCKRLVVGLGGSATNDGGCGAAAALGAVFRNAAGEAFVPVGATLAEVAEIDLSGLHPALASAELVTMCDIDNPLCGPLGAAHVFAPQKGADPAMVELLDAGLAHLADVVERCTGRDIRPSRSPAPSEAAARAGQRSLASGPCTGWRRSCEKGRPQAPARHRV